MRHLLVVSLLLFCFFSNCNYPVEPPVAQKENILDKSGARKIPQIITVYEHAYLRAVIKSIDPEITDEDIYASPSTYFNDIRSYVLTLIENEEDDQNLPFIICPDGRYSAFLGLMNDTNNAKLVWVMPYHKSTIDGYPQTMNFTSPISTPIISVSAGNVQRSDLLIQNEWVRGNLLDFVDSTDIQYLDATGTPKKYFVIQRLVTPDTLGITKFFTGMNYYAYKGFPIRVNLYSSQDSLTFFKMRVFKNYSGDSMLVDPTIPAYWSGRSGTAYCLYQSGAVGVVAAKLNRIRRTLNKLRTTRKCTPELARYFAKCTASNPIRNNYIGYGHINVNDAMDFGKQYLATSP